VSKIKIPSNIQTLEMSLLEQGLVNLIEKIIQKLLISKVDSASLMVILILKNT